MYATGHLNFHRDKWSIYLSRMLLWFLEKVRSICLPSCPGIILISLISISCGHEVVFCVHAIAILWPQFNFFLTMSCLGLRMFVYLVLSYKGPQLPAVFPPLRSVVQVTGLRDAPPHGGAVVLKLNITWRFEAWFIHLHNLPRVLHTHTHTHTHTQRFRSGLWPLYPSLTPTGNKNIFSTQHLLTLTQSTVCSEVSSAPEPASSYLCPTNWTWVRTEPRGDSPSWAGCPQQRPSWRPDSD